MSSQPVCFQTTGSKCKQRICPFQRDGSFKKKLGVQLDVAAHQLEVIAHPNLLNDPDQNVKDAIEVGTCCCSQSLQVISNFQFQISIWRLKALLKIHVGKSPQVKP